jgi:RNA polymerase sigma-70 factor (ECF subfamily)
LTLWPKRRAQVTGIDEARSRPQSQLELFEEIILPHLDAAYNLARWLTRNDQDAQDVVQESYLRAFRFFDGYRGGDGKAWLLAIVRNTFRTWQLRQNREREAVPFDEVAHSGNGLAPDQEQNTVDRERVGVLRTCIEMLPIDFREVLVMRELEEMSYQEIADTLGVALGTVMSRLSRARKRLQECAASRRLEAAR